MASVPGGGSGSAKPLLGLVLGAFKKEEEAYSRGAKGDVTGWRQRVAGAKLVPRRPSWNGGICLRQEGPRVT